ncbi:MAG: nicotinate-nucleotide--dimethylbenzimidazole phosphoribosyltransferase [Candidatus Limnocylindrales bacterium]
MSQNPDTTRILETVARVPEPDQLAAAAARERQASLTKPAGSLGRLEALSIQIAATTGQPRPRLASKAVVVMAADHGVVREGVSAFPADVTPQMVANFLRGGAAINALARVAGARVVVVDMGVAGPLPARPDLVSRRVADGTRNMAEGPAMTCAEAERCLAAGIEIADSLVDEGVEAIAVGDMGIGNTTASSALTAVVTGAEPRAVTGRGTGVDDEGLERKIHAIERALAVNTPDPSDGIGCLAAVGGFEIGGLAGVVLGAAARRVPVLLDGFVAGAAALVAATICPAVRPHLIAAHCSVERGHRVALAWLGLEPLLDLGLRLVEGTGAVLAMPILDAALAALDEMATFEEAAVSGPLTAEEPSRVAGVRVAAG